MKAEFVVTELKKRWGGLELTLAKYVPPSPPEPDPEPEPPMPDPIETFIPETDEERVMLKILKALRKFGFDPFPRAPVVRARPVRFAALGHSGESKICLSDEQYSEVGKPGLGQRIQLSLIKTKE